MCYYIGFLTFNICILISNIPFTFVFESKVSIVNITRDA